MRKHKKVAGISAAMAAVFFVGVCSDFRLGSAGSGNMKDGTILDIAAAGAITYASETGAVSYTYLTLPTIA